MPDRKPRPDRQTPRADRICKTCGRAFSWRKQWEQDWDCVRYCSDACRGLTPGERNAELETAILALLAERGPGKTICPSEAARRVAAADLGISRTPPQSAWQPLMEAARAAARHLVAQGRIAIVQKGRTVEPSGAKGPIRLKLT